MTASFRHGVASGDPYQGSFVIWSRVSDVEGSSASVNWEVSSSPKFKKRTILDSGTISTSSDRDWTVKALPGGLQAGEDYYYRFEVDGVVSPVGHARTLPDKAPSVRMAVLSCSNFTNTEFFETYRRVAEIDAEQPFDIILHVGDYIYEYGQGGYPSAESAVENRGFEPDSELLSLDDYRQRYAQYHSDAGLREMHASAPMVSIWDDHETANDSWLGGAENHQSEVEGDWVARRDAALQAYYEWMPIREPALRRDVDLGTDDSPLTQGFRSFDLADLVTLHVLETRLSGRDEQLVYPDSDVVAARIEDILADPLQLASYAESLGVAPPNSAKDLDGINTFSAALIDPVTLELVASTVADGWTNPARNLLGQDQQSWLQSGLARSDAAWQVLGQQVLMQSMAIPAELLLNATDPDVLAKYSAPLGKLAIGQPLNEEELALFDEATKIPYNLDAWDGYGVERETILQTAAGLGKKLVSLAGDTHNAWAGVLDAMSTGAAVPGQVVGVEFATPGVSAPGIETYIGPGLEPIFLNYTEGLKYTDLSRRGFLDITFHEEHITSSYQLLDPDQGWIADVLQSDDSFNLRQLSGVDESTSVNIPAEFAFGKFREVLLAGGGDDLISAGDRKGYVSAGAGNDVIEGGSRAQLLLGDDGDDFIRGRGGRDELRGGKGADQLNGGPGDDLIVGGRGADSFRISKGDDRITDFDPLEGDVLVLPAGLETTLTLAVSGVLLTSDRGTTLIEGLTLEQVEGLI